MTSVASPAIRNHANFIWSVADLLRGPYRQSEYGRVILPLTIIRRLECVLSTTRSKVDAVYKKYGDREPILRAAAGVDFYNTSTLTLEKIIGDSATMADALDAYVGAFSSEAQEIIEKFDFYAQIRRLEQSNLLYMIVSKFSDLDLYPASVSNLEMGYLYEELIRRFSEASNEAAGEFFTPREVIRLMVGLLLADDGDTLSKPGIVKTLFDPACGTGGMLSVAEDKVREYNPDATLYVYGQELYPATYAICKSDMIIKGQSAGSIALGNSFTEDHFAGETFDYMLANPPFGVDWKTIATELKREHNSEKFHGRFGAGLPRINDGSFLFLQHMISKMKRPAQGGSRLAIVFNGSPLFTGTAGSGESEIRRWIIENDLLEAVVALPDQLFYNTGISTYFWIASNKKTEQRKGKVQLVDARDFYVKMRKNLGNKRKELSDTQVSQLIELYGKFAEGEYVKLLDNSSFGFQRVAVERPLRLTYAPSEESLKALQQDARLSKVPVETRDRLISTIAQRIGQEFASSSEAVKAAQAAMTDVGLRGKPIEKALVEAMSTRDPSALPSLDAKGQMQPDPDLRDFENIPLPVLPVSFDRDPELRLQTARYLKAIDDYIATEVTPHAPDAWVDYSKTRLGYEVPFTRLFYKYQPPRSVEDIDKELNEVEQAVLQLLKTVTDE